MHMKKHVCLALKAMSDFVSPIMEEFGHLSTFVTSCGSNFMKHMEPVGSK